MNREQLDEIHARAEAATKGPWLADGTILNVNTADGRALVRLAYVLLGDDDTRENYPQATADGEFIAHARPDVPALLDEIERLNTKIKSIEDVGSASALRAELLAAGRAWLAELGPTYGATVEHRLADAIEAAAAPAEGDQSKGSSTGGVS